MRITLNINKEVMKTDEAIPCVDAYEHMEILKYKKAIIILSNAGHVSQEQVKRYIQEQEGKSVFEYDVYNCPKELKGQLKIGDFSC